MAWGDDARSRNQIDYAQGQMGNAYNRAGGQIDYQRNRYEQQQNPIMASFAGNYARGAEQGMGDYTDIMNRYRQVYNAAGTPEGGGGGGGGEGGGYGMVSPEQINVSDPFNSYAGFQDFSQTGGYSPADVANMRARGVSPIRAAYANAQRGIGRQRSLQGGYSPGAQAAMVQMAREQGQSAADATQNVEAGLAQMRNQGRLAGLGGMSDIEKQRYEMDYRQQVFNAQQRASAASQNASASGANAAASRAAVEADRGDQMRALAGMSNLYGTTPGQAALFGNQVMGALNSSAQFGGGLIDSENQRASGISQGQIGLIGGRNQAATQPGGLERGIGLAGSIAGAAYPWIDRYSNRPQQPTGTSVSWGPWSTQRGY